MIRILDLAFPADEDMPDCCRAAILLAPDGLIEVALMEMPENHGRSVTNAWPHVAAHLLKTYLPRYAPNRIRWFEVYPYHFGETENVSRVLISAKGHGFEYEQDPEVRKRIWRALAIKAEMARER